MTTTRIPLLVSAIALIAGCASTPSATQSNTAIVDAGGRVTRTKEVGIPFRYEAARDEVWAALLSAYRDVGLEPDVIDTDGNVVARTRLPMRRVFNGSRVSQLFSCGDTPTGSPVADAGQVVASVRSQIGGEFDHPVVSTLVDAYVIPDGGGSSTGLRCGSSGTIEGWIDAKVKQRLGAR
ncbi:MAG TPA: hypothetical protein VF761_05345 [Gemmatimonadaceae bacterium]